MAINTKIYRPNQRLRPEFTDSNGIIYYTDDVLDSQKAAIRLISPNQNECEAYGYTWNSYSRTCMAHPINPSLDQVMLNTKNTNLGKGNLTQREVTNSQIIGEQNMIRGESRNNIMAGTKNVIDVGKSNTAVFGVNAIALAGNTITLGGNQGGDILGKRQMTYFILGATTTTNGTIATNVNGEAGVTYAVPVNAAVFFHCDILAVRVGGTNVSGAVGDFGSWTETGVVISKTSGEGSTINRQRKTLSSNGDITNWRPTAAVDSDGNFNVNVRGQTNMDIDWVISVRATQLQTGVTIP